METKYLWDRIDALRDALKDMKEENDALDSSLKECVNDYEKLQKENNHLELRVEELDGFSDDMDVKRSKAEVENDDLNARIVDLKDKVKSKMRLGDEFQRDLIVSNDINKELRRQVKTLKAENDELKQCSNVAFVEVLNRSNDKLKMENDELKDEAVKWNRKHYKLDEKYYELNKKHNDLIDNNTTKLKFH